MADEEIRTCERCRESKPLSAYNVHRSGSLAGKPCWGCRECRKKAAKEWAENNKERLKKRTRAYQVKHADKYRVLNRKNSKKYRDSRRARVLDAYGNACACCGEKQREFLSVDHIFGGGRQHLKQLGFLHLYEWLERNGYPRGFQLLCHNCNQAKGHYGVCPHKQAEYETPYAVRMEV